MEDSVHFTTQRFLIPSTAYYRPLVFWSLFGAWHLTGSLAGFLAAVKLFHIVPVVGLVALLIAHLRPTRLVEAFAALFAIAVLLGSPGFLDNIEIPLTYTIVGMFCALAVWIIVEREPRWWHGPAIVALTIVAIGFKEQGLVLVPLIVLAWYLGAPGVRGRTVAVVLAVTAAYVALRVAKGGAWAPFEQDVGLGFRLVPADEAADRFGRFPVWVYAYSSASTMGNVLFSEPTSGVFEITHALITGKVKPWHIEYLASSLCTTLLIAWWAAGAVRRSIGRPWTSDARLAIALAVALLATGVLSFNYSRDRLGGMAVVFYALASFGAVRAALDAARQKRPRVRNAIVAAVLLAGCIWQVRVVHTLEFARLRSYKNQREWLMDVQERREEFADRPVYLGMMNVLIPQGTAPGLAVPTRYPEWVLDILGPF